MPLARARSPAKTLLNSPAQRNRLLARNSSSPARGAIVRDDGTTPSSQPIRDQAASKRRIDFRSIASGGPHALSQPLPGRGPANGRRLQPLQQEDDEEEDGALDGEDHNGEEEEEGDMVNDYVEESMAMLDGGDDDDLPAAPEPQQADDEEEISMVDDQRTSAIAARKKAGRPAKQKGPAAPAKPAKPTRKPTKPVAEESDAEDRQEDVENPDEEEEDPAPRPRKPEPGRRGRPPPPKASQAPAAEHPPARGSKKRRSLDADQNAGAKEPSPEPQPKRQRTEAAAKGKKPAVKKPAATSSKSSTGPATASTSASKPSPGAKTAKGRKRKSSIDPGDVSQVVVARRPPLPKSRGLLINRRELPGDSGSMFRTRSGRTSFKPLAYWRNERVDYEKDEAEDAFAGRTHKPKFVLPSIKEVVRVDEPEPEFRPKSRRGGGASSKKGGRRRKSRGGYGSADDDGGDGPADLWELDPGTVTGEVVVWQPEYEFSPPAPNDLVSVMDKQLAISGAAIKTTEVVGGEFRYAKVFSEGFIGAGVVDLPPGSIKRLKNSRKVFMIFFVHIGRVLVTVQETSFRISKGGIFIVPRCKSAPSNEDSLADTCKISQTMSTQ